MTVQARRTTSADSPAAAPPLEVLLVDDSPDDRDIVGYHLRTWLPEARVQTAATLDEARERLGHAVPDVVLLDVVLGLDDGIELLEWAREHGVDLSVVMLTGHNDPEIAVRALRAGAADYLSKGRLDGPSLLAAVRHAVALTRSRLAREEAEAGRRAAEEQYRELFEHNPLPTWLVDDDDMRVLAVNEAAVSHLDVDRDALLGKRLAELFVPEDVPRLVAAWDARAAAGARAWAGRWRHERAHGGTHELEIDCTAVTLQGRTRWLFVGRDVTDRRRLEAQLLQAQRLESIGRLAGGIAHDFNNLLGVVTGCGELLQLSLPEGEMRDHADAILEASARAAELTRQLLAFSRQQVVRPRPLDVNAVARDMKGMLRRVLGSSLEFSLRLDPDVGHVLADPGQLEQVVMNLAINARDAMPRGGSLEISTSEVELADGLTPCGASLAPGRHVVLAVRDDGQGMPREVLERVFDPFFTTKPAGQGTGLGLPMVHGIVTQAGGHVEIESAPGEGTVVRVYLPRTDAPPAARPEPGTRPLAELPRGTERVLVLEDEEALREIMATTLAGLGYRVTKAATGEDALEMLQRLEDGVDLIVADVVLPGIGGAEVAERAQAARPALKVLFVSGHAPDALVRRALADPSTHFLQKPFMPSTLARKVREILGPPSAHADA